MKATIYGYNNGEKFLLVWQRREGEAFRVKELTEEQFWLPLFNRFVYRECWTVKINGKVYGEEPRRV